MPKPSRQEEQEGKDLVHLHASQSLSSTNENMVPSPVTTKELPAVTRTTFEQVGLQSLIDMVQGMSVELQNLRHSTEVRLSALESRMNTLYSKV